VFATCSGTGAGYANSCTSFSLYGGAAGSTNFSPVAMPAAYQHMSTSQPSAVRLVVSGTTGYLLTPGGAVLSGPLTGGAWSVAGQAPCAPQVAGSASGAQIAVGTPGQLVLTCATAATSAAGPPTVNFYTSADGAKTWQQKSSSVPVDGPPTSLTQATTGLVVLATSAGILYSADSGTTWHPATFSAAPTAAPSTVPTTSPSAAPTLSLGAAPPGGFSYIGMTDPSRGVAVPVDASLGELYITRDGGRTWQPSPINA
ncbi:MAG: hypothetical protein J2P28_06930, partial [Actinobacteria bacterium]|nr:hypothetical protein [Actinomycetota bacterium]